MFKGISRIFRSVAHAITSIAKAVGKVVKTFVNNLTKDPLGTLITIASAVSAFWTFGATAFALQLWNIGRLGWVLVGAILTTVAVGTDSAALKTALAIFGFAMTAYTMNLAYDKTTNLLNAILDTTEAIGAVTRLLYTSAVGFVTLSMLTATRDGVTFTQGVETAAGEIGSLVGGTASALLGGLVSGVLSNPLGLALLAGGAILLLKGGGSPIVIGSRPQSATQRRLA